MLLVPTSWQVCLPVRQLTRVPHSIANVLLTVGLLVHRSLPAVRTDMVRAIGVLVIAMDRSSVLALHDILGMILVLLIAITNLLMVIGVILANAIAYACRRGIVVIPLVIGVTLNVPIVLLVL